LKCKRKCPSGKFNQVHAFIIGECTSIVLITDVKLCEQIFFDAISQVYNAQQAKFNGAIIFNDESDDLIRMSSASM